MSKVDKRFSTTGLLVLLAISLQVASQQSKEGLFGSIKNNNQFSDPDPLLRGTEVGDFQLGNALFRKLWSIGTTSVRSADGVGPLFNSRSCQRCHLKDGRGNPPGDEHSFSPSLVFQLATAANMAKQTDNVKEVSDAVGDRLYGQQIQPFAANGLHGEANIFVRYTTEEFTYPDGSKLKLNRPTYRIEDLAYGELGVNTTLAPRVAPPMLGLGLLQAIPADAIKAQADPDDANQNGISGRANFGYSLANQQTMLGRFGWKASAPTIIDQVAVAFSVDMGLSTPLINVHYGDCTEAQSECRRIARLHAKGDAEPEVSPDILNLVTLYSENLAVPAPRNQDHPDYAAGEALFSSLGCQQCHTPQYVTGTDESIDPHLRARTIYPYTDLLLHDMGADLADTQRQGFALANEWRTPPLWGLGLTQTVNPMARFLHDGRAATIEEAIIWHGGEAEPIKLAFSQLNQAQREQLLFFLHSL